MCVSVWFLGSWALLCFGHGCASALILEVTLEVVTRTLLRDAHVVLYVC